MHTQLLGQMTHFVPNAVQEIPWTTASHPTSRREPVDVTRIPAVERRRSLIDAATRVIARRGVPAATTRAIVAEAGMSLASFHYAFESRDELMTEVVRAAVEQEELALQPALAATATAPVGMRDAVRAGLDEYFHSLTAHPDREKAMLELTQYALRSPERAPLAWRQYERYHRLAESTLSQAATLTGCRWRVSVGELARLLIAFTDGLTMSWLVDGDGAAAQAAMDLMADAIAQFAAEAPAARPERSA